MASSHLNLWPDLVDVEYSNFNPFHQQQKKKSWIWSSNYNSILVFAVGPDICQASSVPQHWGTFCYNQLGHLRSSRSYGSRLHPKSPLPDHWRGVRVRDTLSSPRFTHTCNTQTPSRWSKDSYVISLCLLVPSLYCCTCLMFSQQGRQCKVVPMLFKNIRIKDESLKCI